LEGHVFSAMADSFLVTALNLRGRRRQALAVCKEAVARHGDDAGGTHPTAAHLVARLGALHLEANELDRAEEALREALALAEAFGLPGYDGVPRATLSQLLAARGRPAPALEMLQQALGDGDGGQTAGRAWMLGLEARIRLQLGDVAGAVRWMDGADVGPGAEVRFVCFEEHLTCARILLAQGRLDEAQGWLATLEGFCRERTLDRYLLEVYVLQAATAQAAGAGAVAHDRLARAVGLAALEGYVRALLDGGAAVVHLLQEAVGAADSAVAGESDGPGRTFVARVLAEGAAAPPVRTVAQPLVEPLSAREVEVLSLIAAGLSNRQIAERLVIALSTVKRHVSNCYGKLGVHSRTQAIAKGRALHLID
jgi:LuxR family maltose regulon positive regulatory protein